MKEQDEEQLTDEEMGTTGSKLTQVMAYLFVALVMLFLFAKIMFF